MSSAGLGGKALSLPSEKKFFLGILGSALIISVFLYFQQYSNLLDVKEKQIKLEIDFVKKETEKTASVYKEILSAISERLADNSLRNHPQSVALLLKKFYLVGKKSAVNAIDFSDITWYGEVNNQVVSRYGSRSGATQVLILTAALTQDYCSAGTEENLQKFPNNLFLYAVKNNADSLQAFKLYFLMGVTGSQGQYLGRLAMLADTEPWINLLERRLQETGNVMVMIDSGQKILFSTSKQLELSTIAAEFSPADEKNEKDKDVAINLSHKDYVFLKYTEFSPSLYNVSSYKILYGYNRNLFFHEIVKNLLLSLSALWLSVLSCILCFFFFKKRLTADIKTEFINAIENLLLANHNITTEKTDIAAEFTELKKLYKTTSEYDADLLAAIRNGNQSKEKLITDINNHIADSLKEIRELIKVIIQAQEGVIDIPMPQEKQIRILADIHSKLSYLSEFSVVYCNAEINIADAVQEVLGIYAADIFLNNLSIHPEIPGKLGTVKFNKLLFQQIIASLLYISLECSRENGVIRIEACKKKVKNKSMIVITVKDNGYNVSPEYENKLQGEKSTGSSHLRLNYHTVKNIIETHQGTLEINHTNHGKEICLTLFCESSHVQSQIEFEGGNVVLFKKL